ncbi:MAG: hypothetical protein AB7T59_16610 [Hyphomonadaceae bacterium]
MRVRSTIFAFAALALAGPAVAQTGATDARCSTTTFRIYFSHGSTVLDDAALAMLDAAARNVAGCAYSELHVSASGAHAAARTAAIRAALDDRAWDVVRVTPSGMRQVSQGGPEYAEVLMTPYASPGAPVMAEREAGV